MLQFALAEDLCIRCGLCANDCPSKIIKFNGDYPQLDVDNQQRCLKCQHCLAVCPTGAISILGHDPAASVSLSGNLPAPQQLATLIKGRRSVRQYRNENLPQEMLTDLLDVARHAPTGVNMDRVQFHVIADKDALAVFRSEVYAALAELVAAGGLPEKRSHFANISRVWQEKRVDILFRGAPHLVVATTPRSCACPEADSLIALSYFELYAQSCGVGTLWDGLLKWALDELLPQLQQRLGIPEDHQLGYAMVFGQPAVRYQRTVERGAAKVTWFQP